MSTDPQIEKIMALADEYAEAVYKRDRNGDRDAAQIANVKRATLRAALTEALDMGEPVAWLDPFDLSALSDDGWCVVHASRCDPGADHAADIALYAPKDRT